MGAGFRLRRLSKAHIEAVLASAPTLTAAARQIGVDRSTLHRWRKSGSVRGPKASRDVVTGDHLPAGEQTPKDWRAGLDTTYVLSATEAQLADLAAIALTMARDVTLKPADRLAAAGRFQQLSRQLNLEQENDGETEKTADVRPWPRRVG